MNFKKIYVLCPKGVKTGGPELLHQLVFEINKLYEKKKAYIAYYGDLDKEVVSEYKNYIFNNYINYSEINDSFENIIIFPETVFSSLFNKYPKSQKYIWWLSIDNYFLYNSFKFSLEKAGLFLTISRIIKGSLRNNLKYDRLKIRRAELNLCQSVYAENYLNDSGNVKDQKIKYLSDYINDFYVKNSNFALHNKKQNIILYNPKKGYKFTKKIIKKSKNKNWKWIALQGLSNVEVQRYLESSKVYVDFGNHPGKDRLPREAAISGCCIITGKNGSAKYYDDVSIPNKYKFDNLEKNIPSIINKIQDCLDNYSDTISDFENYRNCIKQEKSKFQSDVKSIFG